LIIFNNIIYLQFYLFLSSQINQSTKNYNLINAIMKATQKVSTMENLGHIVINGYNPKTQKSFIYIGKRNEKGRLFSTIHTAYKAIIG
jgi:hypothetical protein